MRIKRNFNYNGELQTSAYLYCYVSDRVFFIAQDSTCQWQEPNTEVPEIPSGLSSFKYRNTCTTVSMVPLNLQHCHFLLKEQTAVNNSKRSLVRLAALDNYSVHVNVYRVDVKDYGK